jgi:hypothetical protein
MPYLPAGYGGNARYGRGGAGAGASFDTGDPERAPGVARVCLGAPRRRAALGRCMQCSRPPRDAPSCVALRFTWEGPSPLSPPGPLAALRLRQSFWPWPPHYVQEYAHHLARRMHLEEDFNATYAAFLEALPQPHEMLSMELFTDELLAMLQFPALVSPSLCSAGSPAAGQPRRLPLGCLCSVCSHPRRAEGGGARGMGCRRSSSAARWLWRSRCSTAPTTGTSTTPCLGPSAAAP